jgi:hypothetical protein
MISHSQFSVLRLSDFCAADGDYREWEDDRQEVLTESIRGVGVYRHAQVDSGTLGVYVDLLDYGENLETGLALLRQVGFPVTRTTGFPEVVALLGQPSSSRLDPDRGYDYPRSDFYKFVVPAPNGYLVCCSWLYPGSVGRHQPLRISELSLWNIRIERDDFDSYPWSED